MDSETRKRIEEKLRARQELTGAERRSFEEELCSELSDATYKATLVFERAENLGLIHGNGHHLAQSCAQDAVIKFRRELERAAESRARKGGAL